MPEFTTGGHVFPARHHDDSIPAFLSRGCAIIPDHAEKYRDTVAAINGGNIDVYTISEWAAMEAEDE